MNYRSYIDGLRAIAVLSVLSFHAFPTWFRGGFTGVDIFFVISGFLISTIIFEGLEKGTFSFVDFYARRIRRIFPALLLVLICCFAFGWFTLLPDEYMLLGKHMAGGASFISNFLFWNEAGYFDKAAETKPLLHLWSLGIEEQFYIIWPLLLWGAYKLRLNLLTITIIVAITSFVFNLQQVKIDVVAAFYSPQTRFWELLCGSILAWLMLNKKSTFAYLENQLNHWLNKLIYRGPQQHADATLINTLSFAGFLLIIFGVYRITKGALFPGTWALIPVFGAILILAAGTNAWFNRVVLANKALVWFGLISYPLYLWHWALLSFGHILEGGELSRKIRLILVAVSILLAWLTYRFVEKPIRFGAHGKAKVFVLILMMVIVGYVGLNTFQRNGLAFRSELTKQASQLSNVNRVLDDSCMNMDQGVEFFKQHNCERKPSSPNGKKVVIYGDSHAWSLAKPLRDYLISRGDEFTEYTSGYCIPLNLKNKNERCRNINSYVINKIEEKKPDLLIIFAYYSFRSAEPEYLESIPYEDLIAKLSAELLQKGVKKIIILGPMPVWTTDLPKVLQREFIMKRKPVPERTYVDIKKSALDFDAKMKKINYPKGVEYISLKDFLCNANGCRIFVGRNLKDDLITFDYGHLTNNGATYVFENLLKQHL